MGRSFAHVLFRTIFS